MPDFKWDAIVQKLEGAVKELSAAVKLIRDGPKPEKERLIILADEVMDVLQRVDDFRARVQVLQPQPKPEGAKKPAKVKPATADGSTESGTTS